MSLSDAPLSGRTPESRHPSTTSGATASGEGAPTGRIVAWALWDWGSAAFNAVITTFVFTVYLTSSDLFGQGADQLLGWVLAGAGLIIALTAPVTGQRADRSGRRALWLTVFTLVIVVISALLFFVEPAVRPDGSYQAGYLWAGLLLLAAGNIAAEFAGVNYNAMLPAISTPANVGKISGFGWGLGYIGGIVLLLLVYFGFISPEVGWFGVTSENGLDVRVTMLLCAVWTLVFSLPLIVSSLRAAAGERERAGSDAARPHRESIAQSYRRLFGTIAALWRTDRNTVWFLGASAIFRDGLAGVFTFGGVIAAGTFGFSAGEVIIFAVAANVVAGVVTIVGGLLDDAVGPKRVIVVSLVCMVVAGLGIFFLHDRGAAVFWTLGLILAAFVGPSQSASRTFLARLIPAGKEGEVFGLYATTGRAVSFLAPAMFSLAIAVGEAVTGDSGDAVQYWGILGIALVLLAGLVLLLPVRPSARPARSPRRSRPPRGR